MIVNAREVVALYESVGWSAYAKDPVRLLRAIGGSSFVVGARVNGELVGLARAVSDDASICFLQDVLVRPGRQRTGVGRALVAAVLSRYSHVPRTVLLTDHEPRQAAFYRSLGFAEIPALRTFVHS